MNKRIMAVIMIIPFAFILLIFSAGKIISINKDIPVSSIEIDNAPASGLVLFDLASYEDFYLSVLVLPLEAKNRSYTIKEEQVEAERMAELIIDAKTGRITPVLPGKTKVVVESNDGGFRDSIIVEVGTTKPIDFAITLKDSMKENVPLLAHDQYDYYADITSGRYYFEGISSPVLNDAVLMWQSGDGNAVSIGEYNGTMDAKLSGSTLITATADGAEGEIRKTILLNITRKASASGITIDGEEEKRLLVDRKSSSVRCVVEVETDVSREVTLAGADIQYIKGAEFTLLREGETEQYILEMAFEEERPDLLLLQIQYGDAFAGLTIEFGEFAFELYMSPSYIYMEDDSLCQYTGQVISYSVIELQLASGIQYEWETESGREDILRIDNPGTGVCYIGALKQGKETLIIRAHKDGQYFNASVRFELEVLDRVDSINFDLNTKEYGIGKTFAIGDTDIVGGDYVTGEKPLGLQILNLKGEPAQFLVAHYIVECSNPAVAEPVADQNGLRIRIKSTGLVNIKIKWKYGTSTAEVSSSVTLFAIKDGVNISDYQQLMKATEEGRAIVLTDNIMLGKENASQAELEGMVRKMPTTFSWQYHANVGQPQPELVYCVEFKNHVYGNGYYLNAQYITQAKDAYGNPRLFKGPADFAQYQGALSLKGQDNIAFLARADLTINNIQLLGCSDESLHADSKMDLGLLSNTGTVLEIMGDVRVINSRIKNGRNAIRAYGGNKAGKTSNYVDDAAKINAREEKINVTIESCILSQAREYLLKIGSNIVLRNQAVMPKFSFSGREITEDEAMKQPAFYDTFSLNDISLKNCVLSTSGLFAIGAESNYAGNILSNIFEGPVSGWSLILKDWTNLGGTSFPCRLRFEGDIRIYDWKRLDDIESSTLLEMNMNAGGAIDEFLKISIKDIVRKAIQVKPENYQNVLFQHNKTDYIHTGILFIGGGRNYTDVDFSSLAVAEAELDRYRFNVSILKEQEQSGSTFYQQGQLLPHIIGEQSFRFLIHSTLSGRSLAQQQADLENGVAYNWIPSAAY